MRIPTQVLCLFLFLSLGAKFSYAQGDGPLAMPLGPTGLTLALPLYSHMEANYTPSQDIVFDGGSLKLNTYSMIIIQNFRIGNRFAQAWVAPGYGTISGDLSAFGMEFLGVDRNGWLDLNFTFRVGLNNNTPALNIAEFAQWEPKFQIYGLAAVNMPVGLYDSERVINLGANRWGFRFGLPMVIPLNKNLERPATWEVTPSVYFFSKNNDPLLGDEKSQALLGLLETHFSKYLTPAFYGTLNFQYQYGGVTSLDGEETSDPINQLGAGVSLGYVFFEAITLQVSYGKLYFNDQDSDMYQIFTSIPFLSRKNAKLLESMGR